MRITRCARSNEQIVFWRPCSLQLGSEQGRTDYFKGTWSVPHERVEVILTSLHLFQFRIVYDRELGLMLCACVSYNWCAYVSLQACAQLARCHAFCV